jgi:radical SAM superfamily enzyme YgiQ (UPF0313 family)
MNVNNELVKLLADLEKNSNNNLNGDRDQVISKHITETDELLNHANAHLGKLDSVSRSTFTPSNRDWDNTSKFKVAMLMLPAWGILFPPYNIAKIVGILRDNDYSTKVYDMNVESYHLLLNLLNEDFWRGERYFLWTIKENFEKFLLPHLEPLFDRVVSELVEANPRVIGFSVYNTNLYAVECVLRKLKILLPDVCMVAGGPEVMTQTNGILGKLPFNYFFVGEAEEIFIDTLESLPNEFPMQKYLGSTDSKLKLERYAFSDYTDYVLSNYQHNDGVSIETSRGCVAQCSFCAETYFWKFRSTTPERVVEEMEHQIKLHKVKRFWFVDSLVNGNFKNFERLIDLILEKKLDIKWNSYARCDGRMTSALIKKISDSGCTCLSYGVESGSQKVLLDMRKKIDIKEIEDNLRHGKIHNLFNHVNWMVGFPTEEPLDFLHSLQLIFNTRKYIGAISPGAGAGPAAQSHMDTDWREYKIVGTMHGWDTPFLNTWYTDDYRNTILNRFIRIKMFHVWLDILEDHAGSTIQNSQKYSNIKEFYKFNTGSTPIKDYLKNDEFVNLDRLDISEFKNNIANEYFTICYALYQYFGKYSFELMYDPTIDKDTFGGWLVHNYSSKFSIVVETDGAYNIKLSHTFIHDTPDKERKDQSFTQIFEETGNINDWKTSTNQTKETVHLQYRKEKNKIWKLTPE